MTEQTACLEKLYDFNATRPSELARRTELLKDMFAEIGENCYIEPPLHANWGGKHVHFGKNVYANFNLTLVDDTHIYVGDGTMLAPNVVACHGGPSDLAGASRKTVSVQSAGAYRQELLAWRRRYRAARRTHRR